MAAGILRRLVLLVTALALATAMLVGAMAMLAPPAAKASPVLQRDHVAAVERGVTRDGGKPATDGSPTPAVALVFAGILLLAALPPAQRVSVYYRSSGSYW
jgi:hypothetical protein